MVRGRGCTGDATSPPNRAPMVSCMLPKMREVSPCHDGTRFLCIRDFSLWSLPPISQVVGSKHLSWSFGCLEAAQNTQHLCNSTKLTAWSLMQLSFWYGLCWIIMLGPWYFSINVIVDNPFFIVSDNSFQNGSIALRLKCVSQILICCVRWISFYSCGTQISSLLTSARRSIWFSIVVWYIYCFAISRTVIWRLIRLWLSLCHHQLQKVEQNVGHRSVRNLQNEIFKTNFDTCVLLNN